MVTWGYLLASGEIAAPWLPTGQTYTAIAAGYNHSVALTSAGEVLAWGKQRIQAAQRAVSAIRTDLHRRRRAGRNHSLALTSAGQVVTWGNRAYDVSVVPAPPIGKAYTAVAPAAGIPSRSRRAPPNPHHPDHPARSASAPDRLPPHHQLCGRPPAGWAGHNCRKQRVTSMIHNAVLRACCVRQGTGRLASSGTRAHHY
ncbi:hypothetical protein GS484_26810 [Rhodococcus hoagii]|nr:hypothetical protein [Prescottella equi]